MSILTWKSHKASLMQGSVIEIRDVANAAQSTERREFLRHIKAVTRLLAKQGITIHGHDETESS